MIPVDIFAAFVCLLLRGEITRTEPDKKAGAVELQLRIQSLLIDCLRFRPRENLLEARIASERIPFPAQTKLSERNAIRNIRVRGSAGRGKEALDQRDRLVRLANECINQRQIACPEGAMKCVFAFWLEFDSTTTFSNGILLPLHVGVE